MPDLQPFEGRDVLGTTIAVTQAGDGLSKAMSVDPVEIPLGAIVHVVLECEVSKIRHEEIKDTDGVQRVHILRAAPTPRWWTAPSWNRYLTSSSAGSRRRREFRVCP